MTDTAWNAYMFNKGIDAAMDTLREELTERQLENLVRQKRKVEASCETVVHMTRQTVKGEE